MALLQLQLRWRLPTPSRSAVPDQSGVSPAGKII